MSNNGEAIAGEIARQFLALCDSKVSTPDTTREKKRCKDAILQILSQHNASYLKVQDGLGNQKCIVKYGKQKMHPMTDLSFIVFAVTAWIAVELKYTLSEAQQESLKVAIQTIHMQISRERHPKLIQHLKVQNDVPFAALQADTYLRAAL